MPRSVTPSSNTEETRTDAEPPQTSRSHISSASGTTSMSSAFSKRMEERAVERAKAKQEREQRKRQQEQQRIVCANMFTAFGPSGV